MNKILFGLGAAILGLFLAGDASAHEPHGRPAVEAHYGHGPVVARPYYLEHGVRHNGVTIYRGEDHHHWGYRVWNTRYNRYQYWDPTLRCYYYWNPAQLAYYPCD
jgi:hypothetical protein